MGFAGGARPRGPFGGIESGKIKINVASIRLNDSSPKVISKFNFLVFSVWTGRGQAGEAIPRPRAAARPRKAAREGATPLRGAEAAT